MTTKSPILSSDGLAIGYTDRKSGTKRIADGLTVDLHRGRFVCLLGPNGTGKSTLIRTLAGLQEKLAGEVYLNGEALETLSPRNRARTISLVLTDVMPMGIFSVYSLVALGRHPHTRWNGILTKADHQKVEWAIKAAGAETLKDRNVTELSDGERQKVMIARALAQEAPLLLLDEPTAYLDLVRRIELMHTLRDLSHTQEMAILQSTHDLELAMECADELWLLSEDGKITKGTPEALALNGALEVLFSSQELKWDSQHGSFQIHQEPCAWAHLVGDGPELLWTKRMLRRQGYGLSADKDTAFITITVGGQKSAARWTVHSENKTFTSIADLTLWIESLKR